MFNRPEDLLDLYGLVPSSFTEKTIYEKFKIQEELMKIINETTQ